jgi:C1A family cysteine protease
MRRKEEIKWRESDNSIASSSEGDLMTGLKQERETERANLEKRNRSYSSPEYINMFDAYCCSVELDPSDQRGVFPGSVDPLFMTEFGGHAMNLVGYNDNANLKFFIWEISCINHI